MQAYKAIYTKDENIINVTVIDVYTDEGGDLNLIYFTDNGEIDKDEAKYFTITKSRVLS